jgi:hypothetical protein
VLHFAGGIALGVNIRDLFEFEGAFERDGIVDTAAKIEEVRVAEELASSRLKRATFFTL